MSRFVAIILVLAVCGSPALGAPLFPEIWRHDFSFHGGTGTDDPCYGYNWNGDADDTLIIPRGNPVGVGENEVFTYTDPAVPKGLSLPIYDMGGGQGYGGDLYLNLRFDSIDPIDPNAGPQFDLCLSGTGNHDPQQADDDEDYDLVIWGSIPGLSVDGVLYAMDITEAKLFGNYSSSSYILEATGIIMESDIPELAAMIGTEGTPGSMTGALFYPPAFPVGYNPDWPYSVQAEIAYSGEVGTATAPEPTTILTAVLGGLLLTLRRTRR